MSGSKSNRTVTASNYTVLVFHPLSLEYNVEHIIDDNNSLENNAQREECIETDLVHIDFSNIQDEIEY